MKRSLMILYVPYRGTISAVWTRTAGFYRPRAEKREIASSNILVNVCAAAWTIKHRGSNTESNNDFEQKHAAFVIGKLEASYVFPP